MNIKKLQLLCIALLSFNLLQSPVQATVLNQNTTLPASITPALAVTTAVYIGYNYLTRQDFLVKNRFPYAQAWYDHLDQKYPAAHLATKQFVQIPKLNLIANKLAELARECNWNTNYDHIYFSEESLKEINYLYKKVIDECPLDDNERLAFARQEFMLLHEAGHIEHHDSIDIIVTIIGLLAATEGINFVYNNIFDPINKNIQPSRYKNVLCGYELPSVDRIIRHQATNLGLESVVPTPSKVLSTLGLPSAVPTILATCKGTVFIAGLISILRYQEAQADQFAYNLLDTQTLQDALSLFENNEVDPLFDLENATISDHIPTHSTLGKAIQTIVHPVEMVVSGIIQQLFLTFKSTDATRWMYDFSQNALHQGPSVRAQAMKNELAARNNKN